MFYCWDHYH